MIAQRLFAAGLLALGAAAVVIGTGIFLLGPAHVANLISFVLYTTGGAGDALGAPDTDNEIRFYSVLWIAFGVIAIRAARVLPQSLGLARLLLAIFFAGGAGRALSLSSVGAPHPLFVLLMWTELLASPALLLLSLQMKSPDARKTTRH
ncbi:MAG: DUF4345 domain-containing protein [Pseudomonadota bacterium]